MVLTSHTDTDHITRAFADKVKNHERSHSREDVYIDGERTNRGNKLKVGSELVHRDQIDGYNNDLDRIENVTYSNTQRTVYKRRRDEYDDYEDGQDEEDEADPYAEVDIAEVLKPISYPGELSSRESVSRTYTSKLLKHFANQSIEIIEKEQETVVKLASLLDLLLGEDEETLLEAGLDLPDYDHNLASNSANAEESDMDKRITRNSTTQEPDPFFALPEFNFDPNQGLPAQDAEEARQLSQLALQRTEEFIRSLTRVRNGIVRAQYVKERLYSWGREMNNDPDESDLYVAEKEAAAKASQMDKDVRAADEPSSSESSSTKETPQPGRKGRSRRANN